MPPRWKRPFLVAAAALLPLLLSAGAAAAPAAVPAPGAPPSLLQAVASGLGIPAPKLEAAIRAAELARWNAFAASNDIPEAKVKEVQARIAAEPVTLIARFGRVASVGRARRPHLAAAAADYLGLTPSALAAELRQGKSLADVAAVRSKSAEGLRAALYAAARAELASRVQAGDLTAEAGDRLLEDLQNRLPEILGRRWTPRGTPPSASAPSSGPSPATPPVPPPAAGASAA